MAQKRKALTIEEKAAILWRLEAGEKNSILSKELGIAHTTISTILKNKDKIKEAFEQNSLKTKKLKETRHDDIDAALIKWFREQRSNNVPIAGPILLEKANQFARTLGKDFVCCKSWIQRFRNRHNIVFGKISGEAAGVDEAIPKDWLKNVWPKLRESYTDDEIFNADETGLFYRMTPDKTLRFKGEKCSGGKMSKERLTILVAANLTGTDKRKLVLIGKSAKPRCFKNVHSLPVSYESNKKAWMTSELFEKILREWDCELYRKNKKILLLLDNCPAHPNLENLKAIKIAFLPPNTTSVLQPMDQGVIKSLKHHFRQLQVLRIIQNLEGRTPFNLNVLDAILMISKAWERVTKDTVKNCFRHAGFSTSVEESGFTIEDDIPLARIAEQILSTEQLRKDMRMDVSWDEFVVVDEQVMTTEELSNEQLLAQSIEHPGTSEHPETSDIEVDDVESGNIEEPTVSETLTSIWNLKKFVVLNENNFGKTTVQLLTKLEDDIEQMFLTSKCQKQTKVTDYFSPPLN